MSAATDQAYDDAIALGDDVLDGPTQSGKPLGNIDTNIL
jgi:hypothetical protein